MVHEGPDPDFPSPPGRRRINGILGHGEISAQAYFRKANSLDVDSGSLEVGYREPSQRLDQLAGSVTQGISILQHQFTVLIVCLAKSIHRDSRGAEIIELIEE